MKVLSDVLSHVVEENQRRKSEPDPKTVCLQCLRCRSEFKPQEEEEEEEEGGERRRGAEEDGCGDDDNTGES